MKIKPKLLMPLSLLSFLYGGYMHIDSTNLSKESIDSFENEELKEYGKNLLNNDLFFKEQYAEMIKITRNKNPINGNSSTSSTFAHIKEETSGENFDYSHGRLEKAGRRIEPERINVEFENQFRYPSSSNINTPMRRRRGKDQDEEN